MIDPTKTLVITLEASVCNVDGWRREGRAGNEYTFKIPATAVETIDFASLVPTLIKTTVEQHYLNAAEQRIEDDERRAKEKAEKEAQAAEK